MAVFFLAKSEPIQITGFFFDPAIQSKETIAAMAEKGFNGIRLVIPWKNIEPVPNRFDFTLYDDAIRAARESNLDILAVAAFPPSWAAGDPEDTEDARTKMMPNNPRQWAHYLAMTVKRYRNTVHRWQIWEKPSIENFEGTSVDYFQLLRLSYQTIKKIDPTAIVFASDPGGPDLGFIENLFSPSNINYFYGIALVPELDSPFDFSEYWQMLQKIASGHPDRHKLFFITDWKLSPPASNQNVSPDYLQGAYTAAAALGIDGFFAPQIFDFKEEQKGTGPLPNTMSGPACVEFSMNGDKENGLFTQKFRIMQKANPATVEQDGLSAAEFSPNDNAFLYVDVDDRFIFFNPDRKPIKITIHAAAFDLNKKAGMNLMYDSPHGYVFSPWITITPAIGWQDYEWILTDANFADKGGFDFRLSDLGSEQTIYVSKICVNK